MLLINVISDSHTHGVRRQYGLFASESYAFFVGHLLLAGSHVGWT